MRYPGHVVRPRDDYVWIVDYMIWRDMNERRKED